MRVKSAGAGMCAVAKAQHARERWVGVNLESAPIFSALVSCSAMRSGSAAAQRAKRRGAESLAVVKAHLVRVRLGLGLGLGLELGNGALVMEPDLLLATVGCRREERLSK